MITNALTEHGGLKEDGTPDKRVGTGRTCYISPPFSPTNIPSQSSLKERLTLMRPASREERLQALENPVTLETPVVLAATEATTSQLSMEV
jgi:hypothetical protein